MNKYEFFPKKPQGPVDHAFVQTSWVRAYRPGGPRWLVCGALAIGQVMMLFIAVVVLLRSTSALNLAFSLAVALTASAALCSLILRLALTGIWVSDSSIRVISVTQLASWPWSSVVDVWFDREAARRVVLVLADGSNVATPAHQWSVDFIGRSVALETAAESVLGWFELSRRPRAGSG